MAALITTRLLKNASVVKTAAVAGVTAMTIQANTLTDNRVSLHWDDEGKNQTYHLYSDMGTGYGVYIYKGKTTAAEFVDGGLRPGMAYMYRLETLAGGQLQRVGWVSVGASNRASVAGIGLASSPATAAMAARPLAAIIPAPTPLPPDALLLGLMSDASYTDPFDILNVVGEVRNDTNLNVGEIVIIASFYDTSGNFISEARGEALLNYLPPGQRSPFLLSLLRPVGMSNYSIKAVGRPAPLELTPQMAIIQPKAYQDEVGFYHVEGGVENVGAIPVDRAKVIVTLYSRGGGVINVGFDYPVPARLNPGDRAAFEVKFTYFPKVLNHSVIVINE